MAAERIHRTAKPGRRRTDRGVRVGAIVGLIVSLLGSALVGIPPVEAAMNGPVTAAATTAQATTPEPLAAPTWEPVPFAPRATSMFAQLNPVEHADRYEFEWTRDGTPHLVRTIDSPVHYFHHGTRDGEYCARARAIGSGSYATGPWSTTRCHTVALPVTLDRATWVDEPSVVDHLARASWSAVTDAAHYELRWTMAGADYRLFTRETTEFEGYFGNTTGELCAKVRAIGAGSAAVGPWSVTKCQAESGPVTLDRPAWIGDLPNVTDGLSAASWSPVANATEYNLVWTMGGETFGDYTVRATEFRTFFGNTRGEMCAKVRAIGTGAYRTGPWSTSHCAAAVQTPPPTTVPPTTVLERPRFKTPPFELIPAFAKLRWEHVADAAGYEVEWTRNGAAYKTRETAATLATLWTGRDTGEFCARVRATGSGSHTTGPWTQNRCFTVDEPIALQAPTWEGADLSRSSTSVVADWRAVPQGSRYQIQWYRDGLSHRVENVTSTEASLEHGNATGEFCARVRALEQIGFSKTGPWSATQCVAPSNTPVPLAIPAPENPSATRTSLGTSWPAVANATSYSTRWTDDGSTISGASTTGTATTAGMMLDGRWGSICVQVRANGVGLFTTSRWSSRHCTSVGPPPGAGTITGRVRDQDTLRVIDNVLVCATSHFNEPACATTGADGTYAITGLDTANYLVEFDHLGGDYERGCYRYGPPDCAGSSIVGLVSPNTRSGINRDLVPIPPPLPAPPSGSPGVSPPAPNPDGNPPIWINDQTKRIPPWIQVDLHRPTSLEISWCCAADYETPDLAPVSFDVFVRAGSGAYELNQQLDVTRGSGSTRIDSHQGRPLVEGRPYSILIVAIDAAGNRSQGLEKHNATPHGPGTPTAPEPEGTVVADPAPSDPSSPAPGGGYPSHCQLDNTGPDLQTRRGGEVWLEWETADRVIVHWEDLVRDPSGVNYRPIFYNRGAGSIPLPETTSVPFATFDVDGTKQMRFKLYTSDGCGNTGVTLSKVFEPQVPAFSDGFEVTPGWGLLAAASWTRRGIELPRNTARNFVRPGEINEFRLRRMQSDGSFRQLRTYFAEDLNIGAFGGHFNLVGGLYELTATNDFGRSDPFYFVLPATEVGFFLQHGDVFSIQLLKGIGGVVGQETAEFVFGSQFGQGDRLSLHRECGLAFYLAAENGEDASYDLLGCAASSLEAAAERNQVPWAKTAARNLGVAITAIDVLVGLGAATADAARHYIEFKNGTISIQLEELNRDLARICRAENAAC